MGKDLQREGNIEGIAHHISNSDDPGPSDLHSTSWNTTAGGSKDIDMIHSRCSVETGQGIVSTPANVSMGLGQKRELCCHRQLSVLRFQGDGRELVVVDQD